MTVDKGVALVVMNKADYISKSEELLNTSTYKKIPEDPTNRQKSRLINILKNIKSEGGLNEESYKKCILLEQCHLNIMGFPKFTKLEHH